MGEIHDTRDHVLDRLDRQQRGLPSLEVRDLQGQGRHRRPLPRHGRRKTVDPGDRSRHHLQRAYHRQPRYNLDRLQRRAAVETGIPRRTDRGADQ